MSKKYTTNFLEDTNGSTGSANQVLISTPSGIDWVDGSGSSIIGGPYLPLAGGTITGTLTMNGSINFGSSDGNIHLSRGGWITFYEDGNPNHGIGSRNNSGVESDDIRINSYGAVYVNLDSNNNNTSGADFVIGRHGGIAGTISELFRVSGETGNVGIGTTSPSTTLQLSKANTEVLANQPAWPAGILEITDTSAYDAGTGATIVFRKKRDAIGNQVTVGAIAGEGVAGNSKLSFWTGTAAYMGTAPKMVIRDNGNVGIGTTDPGAKLDIQQDTTGDLLARVWNTNASGTGDSILRIANSGNNANGNRIEFSDASYYPATISGDRSQGIVFRTSATGSNPITIPERMRIDSAGNVGIGTTSPVKNLNLQWSSSSVDPETGEGLSGGASGKGVLLRNSNVNVGTFANLDFRANNADARIAFTHNATNNGDFHFILDNTTAVPLTRLFIEGETGNVGIGTTSPSTRLEVAASATTSVDIAHFSNSNDVVKIKHALDGVGSGMISILDSGNNEDVRLSAQGNSWLNAGNVGIGTTSPSKKLHIVDSGNEVAYFQGTGNSSWIDIKGAASELWSVGATSIGYGIYNRTDGSYRFNIDNTGNVGIGTTSPNQLLHTVGGIVKVESDGGNAAGAILELKHANNNTTDVCATINFTNNIGGYAAIEGGTTGANNTGYLAFKTDNAGTQGEAVRILGNGNVGIGTTSPEATFVVQPSQTSFNLAGISDGQIALGNNTASGKAPTIGSKVTSTAQPAFQIITGQPDNSTEAGIRFSVREDDNSDFSTTANKPAFEFDRYTTNLMSIMRNGRVGIGTTSPSHKLTINASNNTTALGIDFPSAHFDFSANSTSGYTSNFRINDVGMDIGHDSTARSLNLQTGDQDRLTILGNGNVGIGTTSPEGILQVARPSDAVYDGTNDSGQSNIGASVTITNTNTAVNSFAQINMQVSASSNRAVGRIVTIAKGSASSDMAFVTENNGVRAEKMRINKDGNVGIGTTDPGSKLEVDGGDIEVDDSASGLILRSPNGTRYRIQVDNSGNLTTTAI